MIALLFPGQGSQRPGALRDAALLPHAMDVFDEASEILGTDVFREDDATSLARTEIIQRNIFLVGIASARAFAAQGVAIGAVAGHSIGAFAAAVCAGALGFADALRLVALRGRAMGELFPSGYGMGVIAGFNERTAAAIMASSRGTRVWIAGVNATDQITIAGSLAEIEAVLELARARGARIAQLLEVNVPSHTPLMLPVRDALRAAFARVAVHHPAVPYAANCDGRAKFDADDVATDLIESVALPVRFADAVGMLYERGTRLFVEGLSGDILTVLVSSAHPDVEAISMQRMDLAAVAGRARTLR